MGRDCVLYSDRTTLALDDPRSFGRALADTPPDHPRCRTACQVPRCAPDNANAADPKIRFRLAASYSMHHEVPNYRFLPGHPGRADEAVPESVCSIAQSTPDICPAERLSRLRSRICSY